MEERRLPVYLVKKVEGEEEEEEFKLCNICRRRGGSPVPAQFQLHHVPPCRQDLEQLTVATASRTPTTCLGLIDTAQTPIKWSRPAFNLPVFWPRAPEMEEKAVPGSRHSVFSFRKIPLLFFSYYP
ncbi:hypothetical protein EYF80_014551 [Liparis tanakae]|uniref:Uncharacterized protein n=1 Tax=Liparis tanakae TaxID=230148 RepID=A0A4Z2IBQ2_9TELE|nr:hypothetical protein EYF80_014551 [Liparis tanakae]